jgi:hypothetical protein
VNEQEQRYAELMGREALERQQAEADLRNPCCGVLKPTHAPMCKRGLKQRARERHEA